MHKHRITNEIIESNPLPGIKLLTLKTSVKDVVSIGGSLAAGDFFAPRKNRLLGALTAEMLSEGTRRRGKKVINQTLESLGASIAFKSGPFRLHFDAQTLGPDLPKVLEILAEELRQPAFQDSRLDKVKKRFIAALRQKEESTYERAQGALSRKLFPSPHPYHQPELKEAISQIEKTSPADLEKFHQKNYGLGQLILTAVGDASHGKLEKLLKENFGGWRKSEAIIPNIRAVEAPESEEIKIKMPDKTSVDVLVGAPTGLTEEAADFHAFALGLFILGGLPAARLFQSLREKRGLTYGTYTALEGGKEGVEAFWFAKATFAPPLLKVGLKLLKQEIGKWAGKGVSKEELAIRKETVGGSYLVSLASTAGLAARILDNAEQGRAKEYIDEYPEIIRGLSREQVNTAIQKYSRPENLVTVLAGTI